jgi:N-acetylmuramoyl-L-alanine amidase
MTTKKPIFAVAIVLVLAAIGCQSPPPPAPGVTLGDQTVTVQQVAARLGMRVDEQTDTFVVLRDGTNTVLIFTHDDGRFFVNGKPIGPVETVRKVGSTIYVSESLVGQIRTRLGAAPPRTKPPVVTRHARIVIDPGHGGRDPGTTSVSGVYEKRINLAVAHKTAARLKRKGHQVAMTRQGDQYPELESRAALANRLNADLFVSIHADWAPSPSAQGFTVYIAPTASKDTQRAAQAIARAMATTGLDNRGVRRNDYRVLVHTRGPAVLIELGYLSNAREAAKLQSDAFQNRLAAAIATGISDYLH